MDEHETKVVDLSKFSKHLPEDCQLIPEDEYFNKGIEKFNECIDDASGFLAISFDDAGSPTVIWAGDVDTLSAIGSFEVVKSLLIEKVFAAEEYEYDE